MSDSIKIELSLVDAAAQKALGNFIGKTGEADKGFKKLGETGNSTFREIGLSIGKATGFYDIFAGNLAANLVQDSIGKLKDLFGDFVQSAAEMETLTLRFETLTGSTDKARQVMTDLVDFAAKTPFEMPGLSNVAAKLLSFGFTVDQIPERLQRIGDVAASSGADLQEIGLIFGQVASAGKLTGERLLQFQERAIPIMPALAKHFNTTESAVREMVTKSKVSFSDFEKAFDSLSNKGGTSFQGMQKLSESFEGRMSTLKDSFRLLGAEMGSAFLPQLKDMALFLTNATDKASQFIKEVGFLNKPKEDIAGLTQQIQFFEQKLVSLQDQASKMSVLGKIWEGGKTQEAIETAKHNLEVLRLKLSELSEAELARAQVSATAASKASQAHQEEKVSLEELSKAAKESRDYELELINNFYAEKEIADTTADEINYSMKLEREAQFYAAKQAARDQALNDELSAISRSSDAEDKKHKASIEAQRKYFLDSQKMALDHTKKEKDLREAEQKQEERAREDKLRATSNLFGALGQAAALGGRRNFEIVKAFNLAEAVTAGWLAVQKALASTPDPFTSGIAAAAAGISAAANVARIANTQPPAFEQGGIVPGSSWTGDRVIARVNSGEMILNRQQQSNLFRMANGGENSNLLDQIIGLRSDIRMLAQTPIVTSIDGKEVFNSMRDQINLGRSLS